MEWQSQYSQAAVAGLAALVAFLIVFTVVGNALVMLAVLTSRALQAPQNLFLVSLAAADILVAALVMPFSLANELMGYWHFGRAWCGAYLSLDVLFCTASIGHLCAISLDRYWSVTRAVEYNLKRTPRRIKVAILIVWVISALISSPPLFSVVEDNLTEGVGKLPQCELNDETWYILTSSAASFFVPCLIMILVYIRIYRVAKTRTRTASEKKPSLDTENGVTMATSVVRLNGEKLNGYCPEVQGINEQPRPSIQVEQDPTSNLEAKIWKEKDETPSKSQGEGSSSKRGSSLASLASETSRRVSRASSLTRDLFSSRKSISGRRKSSMGSSVRRRRASQVREKRFTFVLAVVMGVFVLCWFPFFFSYSLYGVCRQACQIPDLLFKFFFWIGYCNSSLNPVIYTIFNQDFRRAFYKILCSPWKKSF